MSLYFARGTSAALAALALACGGGRLPLGALMSWGEYARIEHSAPYVLEVRYRRGALVLYGAEHMRGFPDHPQVADIEALWSDLAPTVAFNEGWDPPVVGEPRRAVELYGEPGLLRYLAARDGVPIDDLEPPPTERFRYLLDRGFTAERIRLYWIAQNVSQNLRELVPREVDEQVRGQIRRHLEPHPLLAGPPRTVAEVDEAFRRLLPGAGDWRRLEPGALAPAAPTWLGRVSAELGRLRDRHMLTLLAGALRRGERVFAAVGASHVVMQEPVLRRAFPGGVRRLR